MINQSRGLSMTSKRWVLQPVNPNSNAKQDTARTQTLTLNVSGHPSAKLDHTDWGGDLRLLHDQEAGVLCRSPPPTYGPHETALCRRVHPPAPGPVHTTHFC